MSFYLDECFRPEYLDWAAEVKSEEYYVRMMVAWYFATALAKQYDAALPYLTGRRLEQWTHNKTIQKAVEELPHHPGAEGRPPGAEMEKQLKKTEGREAFRFLSSYQPLSCSAALMRRRTLSAVRVMFSTLLWRETKKSWGRRLMENTAVTPMP